MTARNRSIGIAVLLAMGLLGCVKRSAPKNAEMTSKQTSEVSEELLRSVISSLQSSFDDSVYKTAIDQLNQYLQRNIGVLAPWRDQDQQRAVALIGPEGAESAKSGNFLAGDSEYLKSTLFLRTVARTLPGKESDPLLYANQLFQWLVREVDYLPLGWQPEGLPVDVCIRGSGTGNERAWIFLELLRQGGLQGCMVGIPSPGQADVILPWLCGVILKGEIYLFEPTLGVPLRTASGTIATLKELAAAPTLIESLASPDGPEYWIKPADVRAFSLLIVAQAQMLSHRFAFLEQRLSGELRVNLSLKFDEALSSTKGALSGIADNQGVRVWQYPQIVSSRFQQNRGAFARTVNLTWFRNPNSARLLQLRGEYERAIREYVRIDIDNVSASALEAALGGSKVPLEIRRNLIGLTPQDVLYFTGVCQFAQKRPQPEVAREWFRRYLERFGDFQYRPDDILDTNAFATVLGGNSPSPSSPAMKRARSLLTSSEQRFASEAAVLNPMTDLFLTFEGKREGKVDVELAVARERSEAIQATAAALTQESSPAKEAAIELAQQWKTFVAFASARAEALVADPTLPAEREKWTAAQNEAEEKRQQLLVKNREELVQATRAAEGAAGKYLSSLLNGLLDKQDLYDPEAFQQTIQQNAADGELRMFAELAADKLTPAQSQRRNRLLLSATFPESLVIGRRPWIAASIRMSAVMLQNEGKVTEAVQLLREGHPCLLPVERAPFFALANRFETEEK